MEVASEISSEMGKSQPPQPPSDGSKKDTHKGQSKKVKDVCPTA